jgi:hypothetical protein
MKRFILFTALAILLAPAGAARAQSCSTGTDGTLTVTSTQTLVLNTYLPAPVGSTVVPTATTSIPVDEAAARGAGATVGAGDILLIIQVQGAPIDGGSEAVIGGSYGDGAGGLDRQGFLQTAQFTAGQYEFNRAAGPIANGRIPLLRPTLHPYESSDTIVDNGDGTGLGRRRYQVVVVPAYDNLTVDGTVTAEPWDGRSGGAIVLDVDQTLHPRRAHRRRGRRLSGRLTGHPHGGR